MLLMLQQTGVVNTVAGGPRSLSRKLWHIAGISGGVDCGRRRRNVYDKKPQRYAKDNRTARSDKSVAYVTNNKRLLLNFCVQKASEKVGVGATEKFTTPKNGNSCLNNFVCR